ncbi:MAG: thermonuclease family protein [Candidatus Omnitrophica bacterium]|nr:thermonuclease family protein [Candidatus Omnitrophota bacterium]
MKINRYIFIFAAVLSALIIVLAVGFKNTPVDYGNVEIKSVVDGDTVELKNGEMARYIGIDTPETHKKTASGWKNVSEPFGEEARRFNEELVSGKAARLEFDIVRQDKYKRLLVYLFVKDGGKEVLAQAEILRNGLAYLYTFVPNVKYVDTLVSALKEAKENRRGIWSQDLDISSQDAAHFVGQRKIVTGEIKKTRSMEKLVRLSMDGLALVIFKNDLELFLNKGISPASFYKGKKAQVFGLIKEYKGEPEIIVSHPWQIEVIP